MLSACVDVLRVRLKVGKVLRIWVPYLFEPDVTVGEPGGAEIILLEG